jgi:hypothetical protein
LIVWVIAGLLGLATGLRIGWALVNQQSVVSSGMIVALGSLGAMAALNWAPLTLLVDRALHWPNISIAISEVALIFSAAGSCVMITSVASSQGPRRNRTLAIVQYGTAAVIAAVAVALFLNGGRQPEMKPRDYLERNLGSNTSLPWLVPLLYVLLALTLASWVGIRLSNSSRRGRALFMFTAGIALIVAASAFFLIRALGTTPMIGVGTAATLLIAAMAIVAAGSLMPSSEDWVGARRELRLIHPLQREMIRRHPDVGIGVRPRGPLVFRVAERLSLISDAIYLEAIEYDDPDGDPEDVEPETPAGVDMAEQARTVARWIRAGNSGDSHAAAAAFRGRGWLRQPEDCSDREWILEIARQYRLLGAAVDEPVKEQPARDATVVDLDALDGVDLDALDGVDLDALDGVDLDALDGVEQDEEQAGDQDPAPARREAEVVVLRAVPEGGVGQTDEDIGAPESVPINENVADASRVDNVIVFNADRIRRSR